MPCFALYSMMSREGRIPREAWMPGVTFSSEKGGRYHEAITAFETSLKLGQGQFKKA